MKFLWENSYDFDTCINSLKEIYTRQSNIISLLKTENKKLKEERNKDEYIQHLLNRIKELESRVIFDFSISKEEEIAIEEWKRNHINEKHDGNSYCGAIGGRFTYEFTPTSLGDIGSIKCSCGDEFIFKEIE